MQIGGVIVAHFYRVSRVIRRETETRARTVPGRSAKSISRNCVANNGRRPPRKNKPDDGPSSGFEWLRVVEILPRKKTLCSPRFFPNVSAGFDD